MSLVGRLEDLALSDIFQILSIGKKTGTLVINGVSGTAMIVFRNGLVVRAETTQLDGTLGHDLLKSGAIKRIIAPDGSGSKKKSCLQSLSQRYF